MCNAIVLLFNAAEYFHDWKVHIKASRKRFNKELNY